MNKDAIKIAGIVKAIPRFSYNPEVYDPDGLCPQILSLPGGGSSNAKIKIIENDYTD